MNILICDDEPKNINLTKLYVEEYLRIHSLPAEITALTNSADALKGDGFFNIAFLDISMPNIDGLTLAAELKKRNGRIVIFFITNHGEYLDDAMDLKIFRFFTKPLDPDRLYRGLDKAIQYIDKACRDVFFSGVNGDFNRIDVDDIKYIGRCNGKTMLHLTDGENLEIKESFEKAEKKLPNPFFFVVHKSFLINIHYITEYNYSEVFLDDERIPIATRKRAEFHTFWSDYGRNPSAF